MTSARAGVRQQADAFTSQASAVALISVGFICQGRTDRGFLEGACVEVKVTRSFTNFCLIVK